MLIAGATATRPVNLRRPQALLLPLLLGLACQFVVAPAVDSLYPSPIPTTGHLWFLYSLLCSRVFVASCEALGLRDGVMLGVAAVVFFVTPVAWRFVVPRRDRFSGLTWSDSEWLVSSIARAH